MIPRGITAAILALKFAAIALCLPGCKYPPARLSRPSKLAAKDSQLVSTGSRHLMSSTRDFRSVRGLLLLFYE